MCKGCCSVKAYRVDEIINVHCSDISKSIIIKVYKDSPNVYIETVLTSQNIDIITKDLSKHLNVRCDILCDILTSIFLIIEESEISIPIDGSVVSVYVKSNTDWVVSLNESVDYITVEYEGKHNNPIYFTADYNDDLDRDTTSIISTTDNKISVELLIKQEGLREVFTCVDGDFITSDNDTYNVLKN